MLEIYYTIEIKVIETILLGYLLLTFRQHTTATNLNTIKTLQVQISTRLVTLKFS